MYFIHMSVPQVCIIMPLPNPVSLLVSNFDNLYTWRTTKVGCIQGYTGSWDLKSVLKHT